MGGLTPQLAQLLTTTQTELKTIKSPKFQHQQFVYTSCNTHAKHTVHTGHRGIEEREKEVERDQFFFARERQGIHERNGEIPPRALKKREELSRVFWNQGVVLDKQIFLFFVFF